MNTVSLVLMYYPHEAVYLPRVKEAVGVATVRLFSESVSTRTEIIRLCEARGITKILCSRADVLKLLVPVTNTRKALSQDNYAGSMFTLLSSKLGNIELVIINPLEQLVSVNYGKFLFRRYLSKFTSQGNWLPAPEFIWEELTEANAERIYTKYLQADLIAIDIETAKEPYIRITDVGYTAVFFTSAGIETHSCVCSLDTMAKLAWIRKLNWETKAPKIMQNGKYDCSYLSRYNAPVYNYLWDTANLMHSWFSELPKDLGFLGAFFCRNAMFWKDLASSGIRLDAMLYNCKDTYTTALVFLQMMKEMPQWARDNYLQEFPLTFPAHMCEMTGIAVDMQELDTAATAQKTVIEKEQAAINSILGCDFNVSSPVQMKKLLVLLGCKDLEKADAKNLAKASLRHPLNQLILEKVTKVRKARKLLSTYLTPGKEFYAERSAAKRPRILYSLNPHGTDTGRLASKEHHFWCGLQIQNIPRGNSVKRIFIPDDGYLLVECDLEQAESRTTAHIAGDKRLIAAVSGEEDFHSLNASAFFGVSYESIYDSVLKKTLDKALRDLAKRVNHGANYNMGPAVLVETMGLDKIAYAQKALRLPRLWAPKQVAEYLLQQFHKTYPAISGTYYPWVVANILKHQLLFMDTSWDCKYQATDKAWTRYCFGKPDRNKSDLNAYVAHCPQSLNAITLNRAFLNIFYELAFRPDFKLLCQIHDSVFFQIKEGSETLIQEVVNRMQIPITLTGCDGVSRTFTIPAAAKAGPEGKGATRWSLTE